MAKKDGLRPATIAALQRAGAAEQRWAVENGRVDSARRTLDSRASQKSLRAHRRAIRELRQLAWIDREILPLTRPIATLAATLGDRLKKMDAVKAALPARNAHAPSKLPFLQAAIAAAVEDKESPAAVARYCVREVLPHIPYFDVPDDPYDREQLEKKLVDRVRKKPTKAKQ